MPGTEVTVAMKKFSDEHGIPAQRFYNVLCMAYGADPNLFADIVEKGYLPRDRSEVAKTSTTKSALRSKR